MHNEKLVHLSKSTIFDQLPLTLTLLFLSATILCAQNIPLPEHPDPIFERPLWQNLNGQWSFEFDPENIGQRDDWADGQKKLTRRITVPFPWGSELSGLEDEADIGWYQRTIVVNPTWGNKRIYLKIGASDWETTVWLDGHEVGSHQGGYVPFEFELTDLVTLGESHSLVIRVDDVRRDFTLYGKQGYGNARGIWQTIYLEARPEVYLKNIHFSPNIDENKVDAIAYLSSATESERLLSLLVKTPGNPLNVARTIPPSVSKYRFSFNVPDARLWDLNDPYLYETTARLGSDEVSTYFGMRKISVTNLPGTNYPYVALNNKPIYLQMALDQSYHPEGFYTFPSDQFMQEEIQRSIDIGLNGIRTHIKVEVPRKLYWADKLGLLVMEDLPNSWGEPDEKMRDESTYTLKEMIKRDFNHPSIFSWCVFNETWGLRTEMTNSEGKKTKQYLSETQDWVVSMYYLAKSLDPTRLVEDNSICCGIGHTRTDLNSWHEYLPGYEWGDYLQNLTENTYPGSTFNFEEGFSQEEGQPNFNSECGNVWGYEGSTGDVDWSYDYHRMINSFRMYPKVGGWLYTEHHDVINEWNGYWRFDRSEKETGLGDIVEGMTLSDLHSPIYLSTGNKITHAVDGGSEIKVPLFLSVMTDQDLGEEIVLKYELVILDNIGEVREVHSDQKALPYKPWEQGQAGTISIDIPDQNGLATLKLMLEDQSGNIIHRNFVHYIVSSDRPISNGLIISKTASSFSNQAWSKKQWNVMDGKKVNGAGRGYFEYAFPLPDINADISEAYFLMEVSAKELFVKDQEEYQKNQDFMKGSRVAPSSNPNSYPMTDTDMYPSEIVIEINGTEIHRQVLPDDPADHRGILSWYNQNEDRTLQEAGSYGYLVKAPLDTAVLSKIQATGKAVVKISTTGDRGMAIYGKDFGRYAINPSLVLKQKEN